jgi:hypothetical protein
MKSNVTITVNFSKIDFNIHRAELMIRTVLQFAFSDRSMSETVHEIKWLFPGDGVEKFESLEQLPHAVEAGATGWKLIYEL